MTDSELPRVLVAEGAQVRRWSLVDALSNWGYDPVVVRDRCSLKAELNVSNPITVILDSEFDSTGGLAACGEMLLQGFGAKVILLSDQHPPQVAKRATEMGAHYLANGSSDLPGVRRAVAVIARASRPRTDGGTELIGNSSAMKELRDIISQVADTDAAVMILGETGTGKELVAKSIHDCSRRAAAAFVPVNVAALPENLIESVLFGHEKGAFTGAEKLQDGLCRQARNGTLFLDEIGELNRNLQPKLLRFLQERTVQRVGGTQIDKVDARVVSATNCNVQELIELRHLREDLFFRLHVIPIEVPTLRERRDDIPLLAKVFLERTCNKLGRRLTLSDDMLELLCDYSWPGNIRQLENTIERMAVLTKGQLIGRSSFPWELTGIDFQGRRGATSKHRAVADVEPPVFVQDRQLTRMKAAERSLIIDALNRHDGNVAAAAEFLGIGQATIYRKIRSLEIPKTVFRSKSYDI